MRATTPYTQSRSSRDPKRDLRAAELFGRRGEAGDYDGLLYGDAGVLEKATRMANLFATLNIRIEPVPSETAAEQAFRERAQEALDTCRAAGDDTSSLGDMTRGLVDVILRGFAAWDVWFEEAPETPWGFRLMQQKIHASTVDKWLFDDFGRVSGLVQATPNGTVEIGIDRLALVTMWADEGPQGISMLRPLLFPFEIKKQILFESGRRASVAAGASVVTQGPHSDEEQAVSVLDAVDAMMAGDVSSVLLPDGYAHTTVDLPAFSESDTLIRYSDEQVSKVFDDLLSSLATKTQGSRALGEELASESDWSYQVMLNSLIALFGRQLVGFIARSVGYTGRIPTLVVSEESLSDSGDILDDADKVSRLVGLREGDEQILRERAGLPPIADSGARIEQPQAAQAFFARPDDSDKIPEGYDADVEWARMARDRAAAEDRYYSLLSAAVEELRAEFRAGTAEESVWLPRLAEINYDYYIARRSAMADAVRREAASQAKRGAVIEVDADPSTWERIAARGTELMQGLASVYDDRLARMSQLAAYELWTRLAVEHRQIDVLSRTDLPEQTSVRSLGDPAIQAGRTAEQLGRFEGAASMSSSGLAPVRLYRSGFEDTRRCEHCERWAGHVIDLGVTPIESIPALPDPGCHGSVRRCRCGWLVVFGQRRKTEV